MKQSKYILLSVLLILLLSFGYQSPLPVFAAGEDVSIGGAGSIGRGNGGGSGGNGGGGGETTVPTTAPLTTQGTTEEIEGETVFSSETGKDSSFGLIPKTGDSIWGIVFLIIAIGSLFAIFLLVKKKQDER